MLLEGANEKDGGGAGRAVCGRGGRCAGGVIRSGGACALATFVRILRLCLGARAVHVAAYVQSMLRPMLYWLLGPGCAAGGQLIRVTRALALLLRLARMEGAAG